MCKLSLKQVDYAIPATRKGEGLALSTRVVLVVIIKQGQPPFSPYTLRQKLKNRKRFRKGEAVDKELFALESLGYLRLMRPPERRGTGSLPEAMYEVHPELLKE